MKYTAKLRSDLKLMGIREGDVLLVHTSIKGLHAPGLTPDDIIQALQELLTPQGTLLVPALSYATVTRENPSFSVQDTPACIGALPERFRTGFAEYRSVHPTHSVCAWGKMAYSMTAWHKLDTTPVGPHSPFMQLQKVEGKILMLGCSLRPNTFLHGVEEAAGASYPLDKVQTEYEIFDGESSYRKRYTPHRFGSLQQRYDRIAELLAPPELIEGAVLMGKAYLMDAAAVYRAGTAKIREEDKFFVD